ncbi:glutamyl-tRNA reductase [Cyclobacterium xiamenense]|uniref:hypothetical protein n=1 Tax=Cyclobacterium xiamenense TaxID=1297121 RepID=UPI0012B913E4|nr:hypothetical protein [Cyclobacterium xiamenense]
MGQFRLLSFSAGFQKNQENSFLLTQAESRELLEEVRQCCDLSEALVVSTPERTEILYYSAGPQEDEIYAALRKIKTGLYLPEKNVFQQNCNEESALTHLSELCFGVQATTYGALPLYPQFLEAFDLSGQAGLKGTLLSEWEGFLQRTDAYLSKEVSYQAPSFSVSFTVADMVAELVKKIKQPKIAILGFNAMGKKVYQNLRSRGFERIVIVEKSIQPFGNLRGSELKQFIYEPFEQLSNVIRENDILISTLENGEDLIVTDYFNTSFSSVKILIDLAVKSELIHSLQSHSQVVFFELADIYQVIEGKMEINKSWLKKVKPLLVQQSKHFFHWLDKKKAEEILEEAKALLMPGEELEPPFPKVITVQKPRVKKEILSDQGYKQVLEKSIDKIRNHTPYKDLVSYQRLVNEFFLYN